MPLDHAGLRFSRKPDPDDVAASHAGVWYDTRRQALWAAFLDVLGVEHFFQPKTFRLARNLAFTPDFWLPTLNAWLVVSSSDPDIRASDRWKVEMFSRAHPDERIWISSGAPRPDEWYLEQLGETPVARGMLLADASEPRGRLWVCGANDEIAQHLVFDAIEIGSGESVPRPRSFPADPNSDSLMRIAYAAVEHFEDASWRHIGGMARHCAGGGRHAAGSLSIS